MLVGLRRNLMVFSPEDLGASSGGVLGQSEKPVEKPLETSAETQNTGEGDDLDAGIKEGQTVPYERFKQVNERRKKAESEKKVLEAEHVKIKEASEGYQRLEGYLSQNRNLNRKVTSLIQDHANGKITESQLEKELGKLEDKVDKESSPSTSYTHQDPERSSMRHTMYDNDLSSVAGKDYETDEDIADIGKRVTRILNSDYPKWKEQYYPGLIKKVYKEAIDDLEGYHKKRMDKYSQSKSKDVLPRKEAPASYHEEVELDTSDKRRNSLASGLKNALKGV